MKKHPLLPADHKLIAAAIAAVKRPVLQLGGIHAPALVGAGVLLDDGQIITSVNLLADVGSLSVCAEPIAIAEAVLQPERHIVSVVAVYHHTVAEEPRVISPCGRCRESIMDYAGGSEVILRDPRTDNLFKTPAAELLPMRYADYWHEGQLV